MPYRITVERAQIDALMRLLLDEGHMTPVAVQQITNLLDVAPDGDYVYRWTRDDLDAISGRELDDDEVAKIAFAIDFSSIPQALEEVIWACKNPANDQEEE